MGANFLDNYLYSGQEIADRGNVIVVTLGYRVGTLGFLSSGDSSLPGGCPFIFNSDRIVQSLEDVGLPANFIN